MAAGLSSRLRFWGLGIYSAGVGLFLIAPIVVIVLISFSASRFLEFPPAEFSTRWYQKLVESDSWLQSFLLSAEVALAVTVLATALGTAAAVGFVRVEFRGKSFLATALLSPLIVPSIVTAVASYFFFSRLGLIETRTALVLAHTCLAIPLVFLTVTASLTRLDPTLEPCARSLGAGPWRAFWLVTYPLIRPGIASGALFAFITSFDEPVIALFIAGTRAVTLPKRMWDGIAFEIDPTVAAVSTLIIAMSCLVVLTSAFLRQKASGTA